jgi:hypothetical protein
MRIMDKIAFVIGGVGTDNGGELGAPAIRRVGCNLSGFPARGTRPAEPGSTGILELAHRDADTSKA